MSLENSISKVIYTGNGATTTFSFPFKVWAENQIRVMFSTQEGSETDVTNQVAVSLSATGGTVTFATAPATGTTLAILRQMPFVQEDVYITGTRFDPKEIEDALDIAAAERQELREMAHRHLTVPATSTKTPEQVMTEIFDTVATANEYAELAGEIYEQVVDMRDNAQTLILQAADEQVERIEDVGDSEVADVTATGVEWRGTVEAEGETQLSRLEGYADVAILADGIAAACQVWTLTEDIPAGSTVVLPNELRYVPGHHHLWLSYGGMVLSPNFFEEVGEVDATSTEFITKVTFKAGQELMAWVIPLGKAYEVELTDRIVALEEAFADLSRRVVYADATDETNTETTE